MSAWSTACKLDPHYLWFTANRDLIADDSSSTSSPSKLGTAISQLREFADARRPERAGGNRLCNPPSRTTNWAKYPSTSFRSTNVCGKPKKRLYIEREKADHPPSDSLAKDWVYLLKTKKRFLVNNLFHPIRQPDLRLQPGNYRGDSLCHSANCKRSLDFISKDQQRRRSRGRGEERMSVTINKNGRTFIVECIIFQDASFEISINDVTQEEEQVRLKRQLTQNIAHELKTPVSSIQGYLETIVSNENIPTREDQRIPRTLLCTK